MTVKEAVIAKTQRLPEDCTWEDEMYELYALAKVEVGLRDGEAGRVVHHEEVFKKYGA